MLRRGYNYDMAEGYKNKKILLVEDDPFLAGLLERSFTKEGFIYELASDGETGLAKAKSMEPDLILLDLVLPGIDGYEVLRRLKADPKLAQYPVIILSNLGQKEEIDRGIRMGAIDFLVKANIYLDEIVVRIKKLFDASPK